MQKQLWSSLSENSMFGMVPNLNIKMTTKTDPEKWVILLVVRLCA